MKGEPMMDAPELVGGGMTSPFYSLWENVNGMAYTPYYYCTAMIDDPRIKMFDVEACSLIKLQSHPVNTLMYRKSMQPYVPMWINLL